MADSESDLETEGLDLALETLSNRHCKGDSFLNSKGYCSEFCELVEEYTGQWQVPLPQLKVLRTAICSFTKATAAFPDDCQHIHYVLSSLALSFFELLLFFRKEEYGEQPLKDILDSCLECHSQLLRHRNVYLHHVRQVIKTGGPWESPVLQAILKEAVIPQKQVEDFLGSELPIFLELRVRYLQACERLKDALALSKSCLENGETGKHLFFHQAYLTCLYKASLHEHLLKEMAEIDGRDAVEIICNTECVEKDELLLSLCKAFLTQQLHNGDMYYIWDLVFIWSRLYLRAHPSRQTFLSECLQLASSATNIRAIFPFIKLVYTELGEEGTQVCVDLCARALQLCDQHSDTVTRSLVCKTVAYLLPHDLEICRACALLVFCQERSLEAYRTVCLLYMHPDDELHPCNSPLKTSVRFYILQNLKEHLCFDPEFWNLLTLRTHCLELISDKAMQAAVLNEVEEEKRFCEEMSTYNCINEPTTDVIEDSSPPENNETVAINNTVENLDDEKVKPLAQSENVPKRRGRRPWKRRPQITKNLVADEILPADDPEVVFYNVKPNYTGKRTVYSLRRNHKNRENAVPVKFPFTCKREYLPRSVKSQLLKPKGHKKRWLQGVQTLDPEEAAKVKKILYRGKKRGRKPLTRFELSYPDNEIELALDCDNKEDSSEISEPKVNQDEAKMDDKNNAAEMGKECIDEETPMEMPIESNLPKEDLVPAVEADPALDGPPLDLIDNVLEVFHNYSLSSSPAAGGDNGEDASKAEESTAELGNEKTETQPAVETQETKPEVKEKKTWKEKQLQTQKYSHILFSCKSCHKDYRGLNVLRHALSHVNKKRRRCILCGKRIEQFSLAKKHIMDHIEEMVKLKSSNDDEDQQTEKETPETNGIEDQTPDENQKEAAVTNEETKEVKRKPSRHKKVELTREERILRNLRFIVKKTVLLHKNNSKDDVPAEVDFRDDQVVIKDDLITLKLPLMQAVDGDDEKINTTMKNEADKVEVIGHACTKKEEEGKKCPVKKNSHDGGELVYYLCPAEMCDKVFLQQGSTLMRHAIKFHINEENVLDKVFTLSKQKCVFCCRPLHYVQHFKDHTRLHLAQLQFFCYHQDCDQRFATLQDLRSHESLHTPFRPQCPYTACESLFHNIQGLYDHEWRHYIPAPQKLDIELGTNKLIRQNAEAPWKQRVKVEELWLQNKSPKEDVRQIETDTNILNSSQESVPITSDDLETTHSEEANADANTTNGFDDEYSVSHSSEQLSPKGRKKKERPVRDPLDVKDHVDLSVLSSGSTKKLSEMVISEHKTFKPEGTPPFMRPPPCMYMRESELSMPKRKSAGEGEPVKKYTPWNRHKQQFVKPVEKTPEPAPGPKRHRCQKCLSSFGTEEELQKHKSLNTCSSLFGFDSDDES